MSRLSPHLVCPPSCDRGKEKSAHAQFTVETRIPVFVPGPDPASERGAASASMSSRQYFPKNYLLSGGVPRRARRLLTRSIVGVVRRWLEATDRSHH